MLLAAGCKRCKMAALLVLACLKAYLPAGRVLKRPSNDQLMEIIDQAIAVCSVPVSLCLRVACVGGLLLMCCFRVL
jgi:hypothetical protein